MNRLLLHVSFVAGLAVLAWVGSGYAGSSLSGLAFVVLIAACYIAGALELRRFRGTTVALCAALDEPVTALAPWLDRLPSGLRQAVRLRIEGERVGLPGPALASYLTGLLVLLGMLGTFVGMVATLRGTGLALDSATDLQAVRASLSAPVKGLGLAFGTSIAGVATSAMLGLMSALARRERVVASQLLDSRIGTSLRVHARPHQRERMLDLLQQQARVLPALVDSLQATMAAMERQGRETRDLLGAGQQRFHVETGAAYAALAASVERSLKAGLADGARAGVDAIERVVRATMAGIAREAADLHRHLGDAAQRQLEQFSRTIDERSTRLVDGVAERMASSARELAASTRQARDDADAQALERQRQLADMLERSASAIASEAKAQATQTTADIHRLLDVAAEAPRAAAQVIGALRAQLSDSLVRDTALLDEHQRLLRSTADLMDEVQRSNAGQRAAIDGLAASSAALVERVGVQFAEQARAHADSVSQASAQLGASAVEVASLGESFGVAVTLFGDASDKLSAQLQRIEGALGRSLARSDEQLAYYVAQAREVIDLCLMSQKQIVDDMQRLARPAARQPAHEDSAA